MALSPSPSLSKSAWQASLKLLCEIPYRTSTRRERNLFRWGNEESALSASLPLRRATGRTMSSSSMEEFKFISASAYNMERRLSPFNTSSISFTPPFPGNFPTFLPSCTQACRLSNEGGSR